MGGGPQRMGIVEKVKIHTPKKPNSAKRKVAKVGLLHTGFRIDMQVSGECGMSRNKLGVSKFSAVLVRPGRIPDLVGVNFRGIRGARKTDYSFIPTRKKRRSFYGVKKY